MPGILTAEELATFDLRNCELAVLSACETNVGIRRAGQGIQSLQTALHAAGARTSDHEPVEGRRRSDAPSLRALLQEALEGEARQGRRALASDRSPDETFPP